MEEEGVVVLGVEAEKLVVEGVMVVVLEGRVVVLEGVALVQMVVVVVEMVENMEGVVKTHYVGIPSHKG